MRQRNIIGLKTMYTNIKVFLHILGHELIV